MMLGAVASNKKLVTYFTVCRCETRIEIKLPDDLTREEAREAFAKEGWQLFPSRCPKCKGIINEQDKNSLA